MKWKTRRGQGLVEYLILVCLIAVSAIAIVSAVGQNIREQYANIASALNKGQKIQVSSPDPSTYKARGMSDFMDGAKGGAKGGW